MSTFANKYPSNGTWTTVQVFSFRSHVHQMPGLVTLCGHVERQYKFALMFWSEVNQQVVESGTFMGTHVVTFVSLFILCLSLVHAGSLKPGQLWPG